MATKGGTGLTITESPKLEKVVADISKGITAGFDRTMLLATKAAVTEIQQSIKGLSRISKGQLGKTFRATLVRRSKTQIEGHATSDGAYARIQDLGGTIVPRVAKKLAVPVSETARRWSEGGGAVRKLKNTKNERHWAFVDRVNLVGKHYLDHAAVNVKPQIEAIAGKALADSLTKMIE